MLLEFRHVKVVNISTVMFHPMQVFCPYMYEQSIHIQAVHTCTHIGRPNKYCVEPSYAYECPCIYMSDHENIVRANQKRFPINYGMSNKHGLGPYRDESYTNIICLHYMMKFNTFLPNKLISQYNSFT